VPLRYRFGAVEVRSDVVLTGYDAYLRGSRNAEGRDDPRLADEWCVPTVVVRRAPTPAPDGELLTCLTTRLGPLEVRAAAGGRVVTPTGLPAYTLLEDRQVGWHLASRAPTAAQADHFVSAILPWALATGPGTPVLHAATLATPAGAVLLVGRSGAGKSTLSTALHRRLGWPLLGDDAAVLSLDGDDAQVLSCSREVRLWDDAGRLLGLDAGIPLPRYGTKSRHRVAGAAERPMPVAAVVEVTGEPPGPDNEPAVTIGPMRPVDGLLLLRAGLMRTALIPVTEVGPEFAFLTRWMRRVRFAALGYPHRPDALGDAIELIAGFAASLSPGPNGPGPSSSGPSSPGPSSPGPNSSEPSSSGPVGPGPAVA
jgi:hypothetical protein